MEVICVCLLHQSLSLFTERHVTITYRKVQLPNFCTRRFSTWTKRVGKERYWRSRHEADVNNKINNLNRGVKSKIYTTILTCVFDVNLQANTARICATSKVDGITYTGVLRISFFTCVKKLQSCGSQSFHFYRKARFTRVKICKVNYLAITYTRARCF